MLTTIQMALALMTPGALVWTLVSGHCHEYHEQNLTTQEYHNIGIYFSNTAHYHVVTSICL